MLGTFSYLALASFPVNKRVAWYTLFSHARNYQVFMVIVRREAFPGFDVKTGSTVLVDRKLQVFLLFLTGYI